MDNRGGMLHESEWQQNLLHRLRETMRLHLQPEQEQHSLKEEDNGSQVPELGKVTPPDPTPPRLQAKQPVQKDSEKRGCICQGPDRSVHASLPL